MPIRRFRNSVEAQRQKAHEMSFPNIFHAAGGYAELVAYAPVLNMFDNSEVEILNPIPDYDGFPAYLGQFLALALVALGSVKKIYATNEANGRKKRSDQIDLFFHLIQLVDQQSCARRLLCTVGQDVRNKQLHSDKRQLLDVFKHRPKTELRQAINQGFNIKSSENCTDLYPDCPFNEEELSRSFLNLRKTIINLFNTAMSLKKVKEM